MTAERQGPLSRFKVIDLTRARAGPTAARQFADWGADFFNLHRNKRSITLNLKTADGVAILKKLAEQADVLIENYRPDVKHRLGFDYEKLPKNTPRPLE